MTLIVLSIQKKQIVFLDKTKKQENCLDVEYEYCSCSTLLLVIYSECVIK